MPSTRVAAAWATVRSHSARFITLACPSCRLRPSGTTRAIELGEELQRAGIWRLASQRRAAVSPPSRGLARCRLLPPGAVHRQTDVLIVGPADAPGVQSVEPQ